MTENEHKMKTSKFSETIFLIGLWESGPNSLFRPTAEISRTAVFAEQLIFITAVFTEQVISEQAIF